MFVQHFVEVFMVVFDLKQPTRNHIVTLVRRGNGVRMPVSKGVGRRGKVTSPVGRNYPVLKVTFVLGPVRRADRVGLSRVVVEGTSGVKPTTRGVTLWSTSFILFNVSFSVVIYFLIRRLRKI